MKAYQIKIKIPVNNLSMSEEINMPCIIMELYQKNILGPITYGCVLEEGSWSCYLWKHTTGKV
jgi:hypothetical protein